MYRCLILRGRAQMFPGSERSENADSLVDERRTGLNPRQRGADIQKRRGKKGLVAESILKGLLDLKAVVDGYTDEHDGYSRKDCQDRNDPNPRLIRLSSSSATCTTRAISQPQAQENETVSDARCMQDA